MPDSKREISLRFLAQPKDVNFGGNVHGGSVMQWLDQAGFVCASTWSGSYCVTAFVGDMNFLNPIRLGQLVEIKAKIIHTGRTSMHIAIDVAACTPTDCKYVKTTRCIMVFIAVDGDGSSQSVPTWDPISEEDFALQQYAIKIMDMRKSNQDILSSLYD